MNRVAQGLLIAATALLFAGSMAYADSSAALKALDPDNDGTIDLQEAEAGAKKVWDAINKDGDDTLEADELKGMLNEKQIDKADPDDDDTLDWNEYKKLVEKRFKKANPDDDGTIDLKELDSPAGQRLLKLIYKE